MQASMAAAADKPFLSDEEYDDLKAQLRTKNSKVVQQARPHVSISCLHIDPSPQHEHKDA